MAWEGELGARAAGPAVQSARGLPVPPPGHTGQPVGSPKCVRAATLWTARSEVTLPSGLVFTPVHTHYARSFTHSHTRGLHRQEDSSVTLPGVWYSASGRTPPRVQGPPRLPHKAKKEVKVAEKYPVLGKKRPGPRVPSDTQTVGQKEPLSGGGTSPWHMQGKGQEAQLSLHTCTFWRLTRTQGRPGCFPQLSSPDHPLPGPCVWTWSPLVSPSSALLGLFKMQIRPISTPSSQARGLQGQKPESPLHPLCPRVLPSGFTTQPLPAWSPSLPPPWPAASTGLSPSRCTGPPQPCPLRVLWEYPVPSALFRGTVRP